MPNGLAGSVVLLTLARVGVVGHRVAPGRSHTLAFCPPAPAAAIPAAAFSGSAPSENLEVGRMLRRGAGDDVRSTTAGGGVLITGGGGGALFSSSARR